MSDDEESLVGLAALLVAQSDQEENDDEAPVQETSAESEHDDAVDDAGEDSTHDSTGPETAAADPPSQSSAASEDETPEEAVEENVEWTEPATQCVEERKELACDISFGFEIPLPVRRGSKTVSKDAEEEEASVKIDIETQTGSSLEEPQKPTIPASLLPVATRRVKESIQREISNETPTSTADSTQPFAFADTDSSSSAKDVATYRRAMERIKVLQEAEAERLYMKKNAFTALLLAWQGWRKVFQFSLWTARIQAVEGKHGSNVGLTMYFLRWTVFLNLLISLLWMVFTVVPFIAYPPETFSWQLFINRNTSDIINGDILGYTWFLYGGYQYPLDATYGGVYEPGIAFPLAACLMLFGSLLALLAVIGRRIAGIGDSSVIEQNQTYPFSSVVFASWDFHVKDYDAVKNLKNAIRSQIREMLHDSEWSQKTITLKEQLLNGTTKLIGTLILWPLIVCCTAAAMFYAIDKGEDINAYFGFSFAQSITITLVSLLSQFLVRSTVKYEGWHPRVAQQVEATKLYSVKLINLAIILYKLYDIQQRAAEATELLNTDGVSAMETCNLEDEGACGVGLICCDVTCTRRLGRAFLGRCVPICEENEMGMIFYRLVLTNGFILLVQEVFQALFLAKVLKKPPSMDAAKFFVNIIDTQALVWLGSIVAPLLPLFGIVSNVANFFVKTCASRNSNMQYNLMLRSYRPASSNVKSLFLVTLLFSALPVTSFVYEERDLCGPNSGQSMADALSRRIRRAPSFVKTLIRWVTNPIILGGALFLVVFFFLLEKVHKRKWQKQAQQSETEFSHYRRDMQLKLQETRSRATSPRSVATQRLSESPKEP